MGMTSTQARLLQLTDRKHTIGRELTRLANDKVDLTRDMDKATRKYQDDLNSKVLKWSPNSGITYVDLSYNNLMKPSQMNSNEAYILTDSNDKVVIDSNYKKYAEMISANGKAGGNWEANRSKVLANLLGISEDKINGVDATSARATAAKANLDAVKAKKPSPDTFKKNDNICCLLENVRNVTSADANFVDAKSWADAYQHGKSINLGSTDAHNILSRVAQILAEDLSKYFVTESTEFDPAKSPIFNKIKELVGDPNEAGDVGMYGEIIDTNNANSKFLTKDGSGNWLLNVESFINDIMTRLPQFSDCGDISKASYYDTTDPAYNTYLNDKAAWDVELKAAQSEYDSAIDAENSLLTADQERQIAFYDDLFSTIADKGWTYNENVDNDDYLNQMLQNGMYTITTVDRNKVEDDTTITEDYYWENTYNTDIATNYTNIFAVNDSEARLEAQVEYDEAKAIINAKESKIDIRMQNLKTEQEAINTMLQSLQSIVDESVESRFNVFG